jgi:hypothetical protein
LYDKASKAVANENQRLAMPASLINALSMESREKFHGDISETLFGRVFLPVRRITESIDLSGWQNVWQQVFQPVDRFLAGILIETMLNRNGAWWSPHPCLLGMCRQPMNSDKSKTVRSCFSDTKIIPELTQQQNHSFVRLHTSSPIQLRENFSKLCQCPLRNYRTCQHSLWLRLLRKRSRRFLRALEEGVTITLGDKMRSRLPSFAEATANVVLSKPHSYVRPFLALVATGSSC